MFKSLKTSTKVFAITSFFCLINIFLFVCQLIHGNISTWNIVSTILCLAIIGFALGKMLKEDLNNDVYSIEKTKSKTMEKTQNEDFYAINTSFPKKLTKKSIIVKILFLLIFLSGVILFWVFEHSVKYQHVVCGEVVKVAQYGKLNKEDTEDGIVIIDTRYIVLDVEYEFGGKTFEIKIKDSFSHSRTNTNINLCLNDDGEFICVNDNIISYNVMFWVCIILAVLTFLGFIFKLPNQYIFMLVLIFVGIGCICLVNSFNWEQWLIKDFTSFGAMCFTLGIICYTQMVVLRIIYTIQKRKNHEYVLN